jgi:beta-lactam-binding protein with PASTA domain
LGSGLGNGKIPIPFLIGLKQSQAKRLLGKNALNVGTEIFEDERDTTHARIYRQNPVYSNSTYVNQGDVIDVWYRSDEEFDFDLYIKKYKSDSLK